ncbi:MAG: ribosome biogenesis GTPase Der [Candidatus Sumerlaeota bacterium]
MQILNETLPTVAIVGRPNVGKSTLFNRIVGRRKAVVLDTPGMTRDRNYEVADWNGRKFSLVDTGGYESHTSDTIYTQMREQSMMAVHGADIVVFLVDVLQPDHPVDLDVADELRRSGKPVLVAVNKCDNTKRYQEAFAFYSMGFEEVYPVSAINGSGVAEVLDRCIELMPDAPEDSEALDTIRIAVIGKPNVGKSSIVNAILGQDRVIVSNVPGTTRDTIDTTFRVPAEKPAEDGTEDADEENTYFAGEYEEEGEENYESGEFEDIPAEPLGDAVEDKLYTLVDTAGLRRRGKIEKGVEKLSAISAQANLNRCDVALTLIDAEQGITDQDKHVAGYAFDSNRACIIVVNKWDLLKKDNKTAGEFARQIRMQMGFLNHAPIIMVSAKTRQRIHKIIPLVDRVYAEYTREIKTSVLNDWLKHALHRLSPPWQKGRQFRIKYVTQIGTRPPTFAFFVNDPKLVHFSYERFLRNRMHEAFGFEGVSLKFVFRRKSRKRYFEGEAD